MLANAGYEVTTLDIENRSPGIGAKAHIAADLRELDPATLPEADALICCETLEHIAWDAIDDVLRRLARSRIPWLILSVPFEGTQIGLKLYANRYTVRRSSFFRKFRFLKRFQPASETEWEPHKWEIGYRGYTVEGLKEKLALAGWHAERQDFTDGCRSVFLVCRNAA